MTDEQTIKKTSCSVFTYLASNDEDTLGNEVIKAINLSTKRFKNLIINTKITNQCVATLIGHAVQRTVLRNLEQ